MASPTYAVLFKTHFWDDFTQRQLERLQRSVGRGVIYVVIDETMQPAPPIPYEKVISVTNEDVERLGLAPFTTHGSVIWYNNDYPHYVAMSKMPNYDYYVAAEYDVVMQGSMDALIDRLSADGVDFVGFAHRGQASTWPWFPMHREIYGDEMLRQLTCLSVSSHRALRHLLGRRQSMGKDFAEGRLAFWPLGEAFLPNEVQAAGMRMRTLDQYGETQHYDWWPPMEESELPAAQPAFVHPVLHGTRYVRSLLHHEPSLARLLWPSSVTRRKLHRSAPKLVRSLVRQELKRRLGDYVERKLAKLDLRPKWYADAQHSTRQSRQRPSAHNAG